MTHAERLVRSLAKTKTRALENEIRAIRSTWPHNQRVPLKSVPKTVQQAFNQIWTFDRIVDRALKTLDYYGYEPPTRYGATPTRRPTTIQRASRIVYREQQEQTKVITARLQTLVELRDAALVRVLGKSPEEAAPLLQGFQSELEKL